MAPSSTSGEEGDIRKQIIEAGLVDCIIAMSPQLFLTTGIPVCLGFATRDKSGKHLDRERGGQDRSGEPLFIDAGCPPLPAHIWNQIVEQM